jgi:hypothetical protein
VTNVSGNGVVGMGVGYGRGGEGEIISPQAENIEAVIIRKKINKDFEDKIGFFTRFIPSPDLGGFGESIEVRLDLYRKLRYGDIE